MTLKTIRQVQRYISPPKRDEFNHKVWALVRQIPLGQVSTYGQIAAFLPPPPGMDPEPPGAEGGGAPMLTPMVTSCFWGS